MESSITYDKSGNGVAFIGPDAVEVYRVALIATSLRLWAKTGMLPTRGLSGRKMLDMAGRWTGKKYGRRDGLTAASDLDVWVQTMKAALPSGVR